MPAPTKVNKAGLKGGLRPLTPTYLKVAATYLQG